MRKFKAVDAVCIMVLAGIVGFFMGLFWTIQWEELFYFRWLRDLPAFVHATVIEKSE